MTSWEQVWAKRSGPASSLADLIALDGFDTGAGEVGSEQDWLCFVGSVIEEVGISEGSLLELGCGAGAFLFALRELRPELELTGIDYSDNLLNVASTVLPAAHFVSEDLRLTVLDGRHDYVLGHAVLHYLDWDVAKRLVQMSLAVAERTVVYLDLPDVHLRNESELARKAKLPEGVYETRYSSLRHTYFSRASLRSLTPPGWKFTEVRSKLLNYAQSDYRFGIRYDKI